MELEIGFEITKMANDAISANFRIAKDGHGYDFVSRETETMFILTARLKGFRMEDMKISISEDRSRLTVTGEKSIQETMVPGLILYKKDRETRRLKKVFKIPDGVDLDRINANFNEEESTLTVEMPKLKKGMFWVGVQEVLEQENMMSTPPSSKRFKASEGADHHPRLYYQDWALHEPGAAGGKNKSSNLATDGSHVQTPKDMQEEESSRQEKDSPKMKIEPKEDTDHDDPEEEGKKDEQEHIKQTEEVIGQRVAGSNEPHEQGPTATEKDDKPAGGKDARETDDQQQKKPDDGHVSKKESPTVFTPCVLMGSALFTSIVLLVVGFMNRSKRQQ